MLTYAAVEEIWNYNLESDWRYRTPKQKRIVEIRNFMKNVWDNQYENFPVPMAERVIGLLQKKFPDDKNCREKFPLGEFKDLKGKTREEIYNHWVEHCTKPMLDYKGKKSSVSRFTIQLSVKKWGQYMDGELTMEEAMIGHCLMLFRTSWGMAMEDRTIKYLKSVLKDHKILAVRATPHEEEGTGVDAVIYRKDTGQILQWHSIKNLNALKDKYIWDDRFGYKHKTLATHYTGYYNWDDKNLIIKNAPSKYGEALTLGPRW